MLGALLRCRAGLANRRAELIKFALRIVQLATDNLQNQRGTCEQLIKEGKGAIKIRGVLAVMDRKGRIKSNLIGITAQQSGTDRMEGAGPAQCFGHTCGALSDHGTDDPLDPPNHLVGGPSRERHQKDPPWIRPAHDQMRDPMREGAGLTRTGAGNHEEGPAWPSTYLFNTVLYGAALFRVQPFEMGKRH